MSEKEQYALPEDDYYFMIRTPVRKEGDASVGVSYGAYLVYFGVAILNGATSLDTPSMVAYKFSDYLVVTDGDLQHMSLGEFEALKSSGSAPKLRCVNISDFSDLFERMGVKPSTKTKADVSYERYQALVKKMQDGKSAAGDIGRALREWQKAGQVLHEEASSILCEIQFSMELDGGSINGDSDPV